MSCAGCVQARADIIKAVKSGNVVEAVKIAAKGAKLAAKQAPSVTRNFGR